jgi:hypothetical protein
MSGLRRRVKRAKRASAPSVADAFNQAVREATRKRREAMAAERAAAEAQEPRREPEPTAAAEPPPPIETEPVRPTKPWQAGYPGEPDPDAIPPQNQWWEERCWFRSRQFGEPYDEPEEADEFDELI